MFRKFLIDLCRRSSPGRRALRRAAEPFRPTLDTLDARIVPAVTATFSAGSLTVFGDAQNNNIEVSRDAAGKLLVNGGAVRITGGTPTVANTSLIQVFGQGGNDTVTLERGQRRPAPGQPVRRQRQRHASPVAAAADLVFGQAGADDVLLGKGGFGLPCSAGPTTTC